MSEKTNIRLTAVKNAIDIHSFEQNNPDAAQILKTAKQIEDFILNGDVPNRGGRQPEPPQSATMKESEGV